MSHSISDTFAEQLKHLRSGLLEQLRAQRGGTLSRADSAPNKRDLQSSDWVQADAEHDLAMALDERETAELSAIDAALRRIADGSYGLCVDCGVNIPTARLHANPTAMRCVTCQEQTEKDHGGTAHANL